jgi:hypothetical protein
VKEILRFGLFSGVYGGVMLCSVVTWLLRQFVGLELEDGLSWKTTEGEVLAIRCREGRRRNERVINMVN